MKAVRHTHTTLLMTLLALALLCLPGLGWAADSIFNRRPWDGSQFDNRSAQPESAGQTKGAPAKSEEEIVKEAKQKLEQSVSPQAQLPKDLHGDFQQAITMTVDEYLSRFGSRTGGDDYEVGPSDVLSIRVFDEPELTRDDLRVSAEGKLTMPLIGRLDVKGMPLRDIEKMVEQRYRQGGYLLEPHVTVQIKEFKSRRALVMGAVNTPGTYYMESNERLMDMLAKAGGIKFDPMGEVSANSIQVLRTVRDKAGRSTERIAMVMDLASLAKGDHPERNLLILDQDVIYVPEAPRFFVTGEVRTPGYYKVKEKPVSVVEAITMAGGLTDKASGNRTRVVRTDNGKEVAIPVPVNDVLDGDKGKDIQVRPNDVIVVPQSLF